MHTGVSVDARSARPRCHAFRSSLLTASFLFYWPPDTRGQVRTELYFPDEPLTERSVQ